jgi:hypothetical protein
MKTQKNKPTRIILAVIVIGFCGSSLGFPTGDGSEANPYQIATKEDLLSIGSDPNLLNKHYILVSDIDLDPNLPSGQVFHNALIASDPKYPFESNTDTLFTGSFNGNNHAIQNLEINSSDDYVGIFGFIGSKGIVENLMLENVQIYCTGHDIGGIAGKNWGNISNCNVVGNLYGRSCIGGIAGTNGLEVGIRSYTYVLSNNISIINEQIEGVILSCSTNVEVTGTSINIGGGSQEIGGLVGANAGGIIGFCKSSGNIKGDRSSGGLAGGNGGLIFHCYSNCNVQGTSVVGGLIGENSGSLMMCYSTGIVTGQKRTGGLIGNNYNGSTYLSYWDMEASSLNFSSGGKGKTTEQMKEIQTYKGWGYESAWTINDGNDYPRLTWENTPGNLIIDTPIEYAGGTGDVNDPYQIRTAEQLLSLGYCWPDFNDNFILMEDIDFNDINPNIVASIGTPAFPYSGIFDGNNNTISNFKCNNDLENYIGMFGAIGPNSIVKNISILNADIKGYQNTGILAGSNQGVIQNCFVSGSVNGYSVIGGLAGLNTDNAIISFCSSDVDVNGTSTIGGLVGRNYISKITMSDSFAIVKASGESAGGLAGSNLGDIERCYSHGWVTCVWGTGGLVGGNDLGIGYPDYIIGNISDSYSDAIVEGDEYTGGLVGHNMGTVLRSYSTGMVSGNESVGGLSGFNNTDDHLFQALIEDCYWDIQTSSQQTSDGGIGLTTAKMKKHESFINWDFAEIWDIAENQTYPFLRR